MREILPLVLIKVLGVDRIIENFIVVAFKKSKRKKSSTEEFPTFKIIGRGGF